MSCALHTTFNGLGYSMNSSGNYSSFAPPCTCPDSGTPAAGAWAEDELARRPLSPYRPGTGAGGWGPAAAGAGAPPPLSQTRLLPTRTNGGGIQRGDLPPTPLTPGVGLTRSMTNAYTGIEPGFSNHTPPPPTRDSNYTPPPPARDFPRAPPRLFRESHFSTHSEEDADGGGSSAAAVPSVRRTATERNGVNWPTPEEHLESVKEQVRVSLHQLLYTLQTEIERPRPGAARSHDEMAADDARYNDLDEQIEGVLRLLTALN